MFSGFRGYGIVGEEELDEPKKPSQFWAKLGAATSGLLEAGTKIYTAKTTAQIESSRLKQQKLLAQREEAGRLATMRQSLFAPKVPGIGLPVIPVVAGIAALGLVAYVISKKKKRRR